MYRGYFQRKFRTVFRAYDGTERNGWSVLYVDLRENLVYTAVVPYSADRSDQWRKSARRTLAFVGKREKRCRVYLPLRKSLFRPPFRNARLYWKYGKNDVLRTQFMYACRSKHLWKHSVRKGYLLDLSEWYNILSNSDGNLRRRFWTILWRCSHARRFHNRGRPQALCLSERIGAEQWKNIWNGTQSASFAFCRACWGRLCSSSFHICACFTIRWSTINSAVIWYGSTTT